MKTSEINIQVDNEKLLKGDLSIPDEAVALVIFAHGSGSSRSSWRNKHVAGILNTNKIATLLTDLLTAQEDTFYQTRFDIELLTGRLIKVTNEVTALEDLKDVPVGYFGASTGAASALKAETKLTGKISAIVSRGGRPDLAGSSLKDVKASTLLIVGSLDTDVIVLNKHAYDTLKCEKDMQIVNGAGHLFEEWGKLDEVEQLAVNWFNKYLVLKSKTIIK